MEDHLSGLFSIQSRIDDLPRDLMKGAQSALLNTPVLEVRQNSDVELFIEQEFWINGVWTGFIDLVVRGNDGRVSIHDHKFTSSKRWIPGIAELKNDPQTIIYAKAVSDFFDVDTVTCHFDYYGTRSIFWEPRTFELTQSQIEVRWGELKSGSLKLLENYGRSFDDTHPNYLSCRDYGGCEFAEVCHSR